MPQTSVQDYLIEMEALVERLREELGQQLDVASVEQTIMVRLNELGAELVKQVLETQLEDEDFLAGLKFLGGQRALKFKEYRRMR